MDLVATDVRLIVEKFTWTYRLLSLEVKTLEGIFFTDGVMVYTCFAHLHSGNQALKGEFLLLRLAMCFDSSYASPSFQQRNRIRCHLNAKARSAGWWRLPTLRS